MSYYAVQRIHGFEGTDDRLYVFDSRRERDFFLKHGAYHSWSLVVPWETFPVKASEAKAFAKADDFGDRYAYLYDGGVRYVWGQEGYERWEREWEREHAA